MRILGPAIAVALFSASLCAPISGQVTQRVSLDSSGQQAVLGDSTTPSISSDGRYVAFLSYAANLVQGDTNGCWDVFVRDRVQGTTARVSVDSAGVQANNSSQWPSISADGRYVVYRSSATNLVAGDTNGVWDVFLCDRLLGTTERISVSSTGTQGDQDSGLTASSISADGRFVAFESSATNLVVGDTNGRDDVFVRDRQAGTTERISVDSNGIEGQQESHFPSISGDGRYVAFGSNSPNLVPGDPSGNYDAFVRDRQLGTTEWVSVNSFGVGGNGDSGFLTTISADGRCVAFWSNATNLVSGDTNGLYDLFVHDRQSGTTERVNVDSTGAQSNGGTYNEVISVSGDGRFVAFSSLATNLVPGDTNGGNDAFVHDRQSGTTERVSIDSSGVQGNASCFVLCMSTDGRFVAFDDQSSNLVPGDTNAVFDIFVHDRAHGAFSSLCDPGAAGTIVCPCSNPPASADRGCDNSSSTGGAALAISGGEYLSSDSLYMTTDGEKATATSIVLQGSSVVATGVIYGQGVRCVSGMLKRLFTKTASGGSILAPDFGAGDVTVSARSAAKGDVIQAGQSRWYLVYYRDPAVLGGCPASSTFNATQTGLVTWLP